MVKQKLSKYQAIRTKIKEKRSWRWAFRGLVALFGIAVFANFLANDKPLLCSIDNKIYAPIIKSVGVDLGLTEWPADQMRKRWYDDKRAFDWAFWPPVPYGPNQQDIYNNSFTSPFAKQEIDNNWWRHWLGTDDLGRDVLSGMIWGTRTAMLIGLCASGLAALIGLFLGSLAGYFGDNSLVLSTRSLLGGSLGGLIGGFWGFIARKPLWDLGERTIYILGGIVILLLCVLVFTLLIRSIWQGPLGQRKRAIPIDSMLMRVIELITSIPVLLLLLSIVAIVRDQSVLSIVLIIGLLGWTQIARFVRGELLRIRELEYLDAAKVMGFHPLRILFKQALPNALGPVYVALAFSVAGTVLLETGLSFLGIGIPEDMASWGRLLSYAREAPEAWWLAIFPGLAIFITVVVFNLLGEALSED